MDFQTGVEIDVLAGNFSFRINRKSGTATGNLLRTATGAVFILTCVKDVSFVIQATGDSILTLLFFSQAIDTLKTFEKKDSKMASQAAVNLSFLYFLVSY